jgi:hypothetical protein
MRSGGSLRAHSAPLNYSVSKPCYSTFPLDGPTFVQLLPRISEDELEGLEVKEGGDGGAPFLRG